MFKILAIDDDFQINALYEALLDDMGLDYQIATTLAEAKELFRNTNFDLILLDLELPDGNGLDVLPEFKNGDNAPEVIIITGTGDKRGAELAFEYGAWDYVPKPMEIDAVSLAITRALDYRKEKLEKSAPKPLERSAIIGDSLAIRKNLEDLGKAAATDASVLVTGETGTGKELFAKALHENSKRAAHPFVVVDCGALPETLIENTLFGHEKGAFTGADRRQRGLLVQANGGTVMFDEIGELPLGAQKSFLRALQERKVRSLGSNEEVPFDVRLVAATNVNLSQMVKEGTFRQDLYYRIRSIELTLPPLRDRGEDVSKIAYHKLYDLCTKYSMPVKAVSPEFFKTLENYSWPGNVRELINALEHALASAGDDSQLYPKHLPTEIRISRLDIPGASATSHPQRENLEPVDNLPPLAEYRRKYEKRYLELLVQCVQGDTALASKISGVSRSRLYDLLGKHSLGGFSIK